MDIIFKICCGIIYAISLVTGFSYEIINTFLFIYLEPLILVVSGWMITAYGIKHFKHDTFIKVVLPLSIIYNVCLTTAAVSIWRHYSQFSMQIACERAYIDLDTLGRITGLGYVNINLFLFIVLFLFVLTFNICVLICQRIICKKSHSRHSSIN